MVDALIAGDVPLTLENVKADNAAPVTRIGSNWLYRAGMRLDAGHYNSETMDAHRQLESSGLAMKRLGDVTERIFIPPRFKRVYVDQDHGIPFLQGTHLPQFKPTDIKYLSQAVHKKIGRLDYSTRVGACDSLWYHWTGGHRAAPVGRLGRF